MNRTSKVIAVLKLEKEEGVQLKELEIEGKKTFELTNLKDLILSKRTRLFKIGVFYKSDENSYEGIICDNQLTGKGDVANFFLNDFLGCILKRDPAVLTKDFYSASLSFIKDCIGDPLTQAQCRVHLQSYLLSQDTTINPRDFALHYLEPIYRTNYENYLNERNVPIQSILKNTAYVYRHINKGLYEFENGIRISGEPDIIENNTEFESLANGNTKVTIESRLKGI
jgi:hypothetical protein